MRPRTWKSYNELSLFYEHIHCKSKSHLRYQTYGIRITGPGRNIPIQRVSNHHLSIAEFVYTQISPYYFHWWLEFREYYSCWLKPVLFPRISSLVWNKFILACWSCLRTYPRVMPSWYWHMSLRFATEEGDLGNHLDMFFMLIVGIYMIRGRIFGNVLFF